MTLLQGECGRVAAVGMQRRMSAQVSNGANITSRSVGMDSTLTQKGSSSSSQGSDRRRAIVASQVTDNSRSGGKGGKGGARRRRRMDDERDDEFDSQEEESDEPAFGGPGACLTWTTADGGKLWQTWTEEGKSEVTDALACFVAGKNIPAFKFKRAQRRSTVGRNTGVNSKDYRKAWCEFAKQAYEWQGTLMVYPNEDPDTSVHLVFRQSNNEIIIASPGEAVSTEGSVSVAALHPSKAETIMPGQSITQGRFQELGRYDPRGYALQF